ncbi:phosphoglucomutase, putative [Perkinsus marinus ATCC 50983]|uniref:Phosphoglucomutase, putative n=1 Tax=Perkinsus marinus (strain ATCC 50983 / TXsc) TaxID=423536 RepID=C5KBU0_PERM5|nr:phosphoglucomutase, putative [Perkinsus marinus ATCC 50983]EER17971.1 phosphoglucomutase, putative [Perkinsus marinus ATCC 50983]|eukprot:XP_002786175.1 phosphoglucomutase, putative [Perkinsus marinus ATCC 50983]
MSSSNKALQYWLSLDFYKATRDEASSFSEEDIAEHLNPEKRLVFGTAGLRSRMGAGFDRMNCLTVMQASQGLCRYLEGQFGKEALAKRGVVFGFDGRYNSRRFAHVAAAVFLSQGAKVYLYDKATTCTPFNPYLVKKYNCCAGAQVTASHNPKMDNGYKVYAANGAQIIPPMDSQISDSIAKNLVPWKEALELLDVDGECYLKDTSKIIDPYDDVLLTYLDQMYHELCRFPEENKKCTLKFAYTAMHGVGLPFTTGLLKRFNIPDECIKVFEPQAHPDPEFPTVPFPNPEEKGALNLCLAFAKENNCDYVIANDPDSDRFTACEKQKNGEWHQFTGDELGTIFGDFSILMALRRGVPAEKCLVLNSTVSSKMLAAVAKHYGCRYTDTLTGFKWLANTSLKMTEENPELVHCLAYEEAIGYALTMAVPDKDGVTAASVWAEMANYWRREKGITLYERLEELRQTVGYFANNNGYFLCYEPAVMKQIFDNFRNNGDYAKTLGSSTIAGIRDVTLGYDSRMADKKSILPTTPDQQMITLYFDNNAVVTLRGSGTEPKLKYYCEMSDRVSEEQAKANLDVVVNDVINNFLQPEKNGLERR